MIPPPTPILALGPDGCRARLDDGEVLDFALDGSTEESATLRRLFGTRTSVDAAIDPAQVLELSCPDIPSDLQRWLAEQAPLLPAALVWTRPFTSASHGRQVVALVRKDWLTEQCRQFEAASRVPVRPVLAEAGVPFCYRSPLARARWLTSLAVIGLSLAVAGAALTERTLTLKQENQSLTPPSGKLANLYSGPGFAQTLAETVADLPPKASLAAFASPAIGHRQVELLTVDPDQLRQQMQDTAFSRNFAEAGQLRQPDMMFRVTYNANPAAPLPGLTPAQRAMPISAASTAEAEAILRRQVEAQAMTAKLSLRLLPDVRKEAGILQLHIEGAGPQAAVLAFAQALEGGPLSARLAVWRLEADPAGWRLSGDLVAPWVALK